MVKLRPSALTMKMVRDLSHMRGQALAIALVVTASISVFVCLVATYQSLGRTLYAYYDEFHFADVFARVSRAPETLRARIAAIPGVAQVETRVVADVVLDVPGLSEPAVGRLLSIPETGSAALDDIYLRSGRLPEPGREGEALVSESFAQANRLALGAQVAAVIHGRWQRLRLVGLALSPEYIYQIRPGEILPDERRFGVFWMRRPQVAAAIDMDGAFNDVALTLSPGASAAEVIARLDALLRRYGGAGAYGRDRQVSHFFLKERLLSLRANAVITPGVFLFVAAFLLHVVLTRTVGTQRGQIAALKAFGYPNWRIALHYLQLTLCIVVLGALVGVGVGAWLGMKVTQLYTSFYRFPILRFTLPLADVPLAVLVSTGAAVLGSVSAVRRVVRLPPAEAMQPEPPPVYRPTLVERLGLHELLSQPARMILRNLERRPGRALTSVLAMAFAMSLLVVGEGERDAMEFLMNVLFERAQHEDVTVTFTDPRGVGAEQAARRLPGVLRIKPFRSVAATLRCGSRSRDTAVMGLPRVPELHRLVDVRLREHHLPEAGMVLNKLLADKLGVRRGDLVTVEVQEGARPVWRVPVVELIDELVGLSAYMERGALNRLMREGSVTSGAFLQVDARDAAALYDQLKRTPGVMGVSVKRAARGSFEKIILQSMNGVRYIVLIFAVIIAFAVVYNAARIALAERSRELASLRVIGLSRAAISFILLGELAALTLAALPVGCGLGYLFMAALSAAYQLEQFRFPLVLHLASYAYAVVVLCVASLLSSLIVRRRLDRLDLVEVLKTRE